MVMGEFLGLRDTGFVGLRVGAEGEVSTIPYRTTSDGRILFNHEAWRNFSANEEHLQIGQVVLMTARETPARSRQQAIFVIDIINA